MPDIERFNKRKAKIAVTQLLQVGMLKLAYMRFPCLNFLMKSSAVDYYFFLDLPNFNEAVSESESDSICRNSLDSPDVHIAFQCAVKCFLKRRRQQSNGRRTRAENSWAM